MPSFDIVSEVNMAELENAINNVIREVGTRYDFRNSKTAIELDKKEKIIHIVTGGDLQMASIKDMIQNNCIKRKVDIRFIEFKDVEPTAQGAVKRDVKISEGMSKDHARKLVKMIKDLDLKVQAAIQDEQVRVTGKKIDDLQAVIAALRATEFELPLQYINMKS